MVSHHRFMHLCSTANVVRSSVQSLTIHCGLIVVAPLSSTVMQEKKTCGAASIADNRFERAADELDGLTQVSADKLSPQFTCVPPSSDLPISARWHMV